MPKDPDAGLSLIRIYDQLENYIGKELYFVIENGNETGFSFINVDDFRTSMTEKEVKVLRQDPLASIFLNLVLKKYGELPPTYQVVGFDDSPIASEYLIPFSTIHQQIDVLTKEAN